MSGAADNATYSVIQSTDGQLDMHWSANGNVYAIAIASNDTTNSIPNPNNTVLALNSTEITTDFAAAGGAILGDANGRVLHGYTNELDTYKATRPRLHLPNSLPRTSRIFTLRAVKDANGGPDFLGAQDTAGTTLAPVVCVYKDLFPKVILAADPVLGAKTLQNTPAITGPGVTLCGYLPFRRSGG